MTIEDLKVYKEKLSKLNEYEKKKRDLYLKDLASGKIQGPLTGYSSVDKPWLKYYSDISINSNLLEGSISKNMDEIARCYADMNSTIFSKIKRTYKKDIEKGNAIAKSLMSYGVKPGEKILISIPCIPEYRYLFYAINKIGAISVWLDFRTGEKELIDCIEKIESCNLAFTFRGVCEKIEKAINNSNNNIKNIVEINPSDTIVESSISHLLSLKEEIESKNVQNIKKVSFKTFLKQGKSINNFECYSFGEGDTAAIVFTGGTTGPAKGVELTNENFNALVNGYDNTSLEFKLGDEFLQFLPPWTAYGLAIDYVCFILGLTSKYIPKLDPSNYDKLILKEKPQHTTGIPKNLDILLNSKNIKKTTDLSFFKTAAVGADMVNINKEKEINDFFSKHNSETKVVKGYGMTEGCATVCTTTNKVNKVGSVGIPFVKNSIKIVSTETNEELYYGQIGEICYCGPSVMKQYYKDEVETEKIIENDIMQKRYVHSGDLGYVDSDGFLYIVGRIKRMFVRSGFKIFSSEIENTIGAHPDVDSVVAVGVPDEIEGSIPVVNIVLKENSTKLEIEVLEEIDSLCKKSLFEYYFPLEYIIVDSIPYTKNGKVDFIKITSDSKNKLTYEYTKKKNR